MRTTRTTNGTGARWSAGVRAGQTRRHLAGMAGALLGCTALGSALLGAPGAHAAVDFDVPMRDGVVLKTTVYATGDDLDTPKPVILRRTPYGRSLPPLAVGAFNQAGYTVVTQDVRGMGDSGGTFLPFMNDALDGDDTLTWIAGQGFSNGRVGTFGASAEGVVQYMAYGEGNDAQRCAHIAVAGADGYRNAFDGGVFRDELVGEWMRRRGTPEVTTLLLENEAYSDYWAPVTLTDAELANIDGPVLLQGGFFDIWSSGVIDAFLTLKEKGGAPASTWLIMGPWTHTGMQGNQQGSLTFPQDSAYNAYVGDLTGLMNHCLRDGAAPSWAPVRYYVSRIADDGVTGAWRTAETWPPAGSAPTTLYLHEDGVLRQAENAADDGPTAVDVDPADPVPTVGGGNLFEAAGPLDQSTVLSRGDVFVLRTPAMAEDTEVVGTVSAQVYAASATTDVDVIATLILEQPSGDTVALAHGAQRGRYVEGTDAIRPLTPGEPVLFDVNIGPVAVTVPQGAKLALVLSGTGAPRYAINPNVAEPIASNPQAVPTTLSVYHDDAHPSALVLPIAAGTLPDDPAQETRGNEGDGQPNDNGSPSGCNASGTLPALWIAFGLLGLRSRRRLVM